MLTLYWWSGSDLVSDAIKAVTASQFSHVAVAIDSSLWEAVPPAVHRYDNGQAVICAASAAAHKTFALEPDRQAAVVTWLNAQIGDRYDWLDDLSLALGRPVTGEGHEMCASLAAEALIRAGLGDAIQHCYAETPGSLAQRYLLAGVTA